MLNDCPQVSFCGRRQHRWPGLCGRDLQAPACGQVLGEGSSGGAVPFGSRAPSRCFWGAVDAKCRRLSVGPALLPHRPVWVPAGCHPRSKLHLGGRAAYRELCLWGHVAALC